MVTQGHGFVEDMTANTPVQNVNIQSVLYIFKVPQIFKYVYSHFHKHMAVIVWQMPRNLELELELENCLFDKKKIQTWHNITESTWQYGFFVVGRPLQRHWAHRLRKGHPRVLQCINKHCTMKDKNFGSVGKLNTHTSWDRAPSRLTRGTQLTIIMRGKESKTSVLNTTS